MRCECAEQFRNESAEGSGNELRCPIVWRLIEFGAMVSLDVLEFAKQSYPHKPEVIHALNMSRLNVELNRDLRDNLPRGKCLKV